MNFERILAALPWVLFSVPSIAADHRPIASNSVTLIVGDDGRVYASGDARPNRGDDSEVLRNHFTPIAGLENIVSVDVDRNASDGAAALDQDGSVWLWGRDWCEVVRGQETDARHVPAKHPGLTNIKSIALGTSHLVALHRDGRVLTIGATYDANDTGVLGSGTRETPNPKGPSHGVVEVSGINDAVAIAASEEVTLILRNDGTVWGVGATTMLGESVSLVQLTDPPPVVTSPRRIAGIRNTGIRNTGLRNIVAISAGLRFAIALDKNGDVWGWGLNDSGQLGVPVSDLVTVRPRKLSGLRRITSIAAGSDFVLAVDASGKVLGQGGNTYGTLGNDGNELEGELREMDALSDVKHVFAGYYNGFAMRQDGSIMGWGSNDPSVGGFAPTKPPSNVLPTMVDVNLEPPPPSEILQAGGASVTVFLRLNSYFFQSESLRLDIDAKRAAKWKVTEAKDESEVTMEIPAGAHRYVLSGQAVTESGAKHKISGAGVIIVSGQTMESRFDAMVAENGLAKAIEAFAGMMTAAADSPSLTPPPFLHSDDWLSEQRVAAEDESGGDDSDLVLKSLVYQALAGHYANQGVAPIVVNQTGERTYASVSLPESVEDIERGQTLGYVMMADGW